MTKQYADAVKAYSFAGFLDNEDPSAPLHAAECHIALGKRAAAISGLHTAIEWAEDHPQHQPIKMRAQALLKLLDTGANAG